MSLRIWPIF